MNSILKNGKQCVKKKKESKVSQEIGKAGARETRHVAKNTAAFSCR
jgi:hypothetical protein